LSEEHSRNNDERGGGKTKAHVMVSRAKDELRATCAWQERPIMLDIRRWHNSVLGVVAAGD
jgi:hypothetical protein